MIRHHSLSIGQALFFAGGLVLLASGCGNVSRAYTPSASGAREALDTALTTWQKGAKPESLARGSPAIQVMDYQWQSGRELDRFEIVEEVPGEAEIERRFTVRLALKKGKGETTVRYMIIGREPLWVYRDEDYQRSLNMDNNPNPRPQPARTYRRR